jgi:DUF438 domain-containing protein
MGSSEKTPVDTSPPFSHQIGEFGLANAHNGSHKFGEFGLSNTQDELFEYDAVEETGAVDDSLDAVREILAAQDRAGKSPLISCNCDKPGFAFSAVQIFFD